MFPSPLYFKLLHTTFLALCTTQIQMFMVTFLTFVFPLFPLCFRLQLGTEQAVVRNNFIILSRLACTWGISGTLYEMRNPWCKGSGTSDDFSWPNPKSFQFALKCCANSENVSKEIFDTYFSLWICFHNFDVISFWVLFRFLPGTLLQCQCYKLVSSQNSASDVAAVRLDNEGTKPHWLDSEASFFKILSLLGVWKK